MSKNTMMVYGCGGCGVNQLIKSIDIEDTWAGYALTRSVAIDTSESNITDELKDTASNAIYLVPGVDGTGKDQELAESIGVTHIETILKTFKPCDLNLVCFSLSGGTGSVMGRLILQELVRRGHPAIGIVVGNINNGKEAENTYRTLAKLQKWSTENKLPVTLSTKWLSEETTVAEVDAQIYGEIRRLGVLASGQNGGLDSKDITNWLNYTSVVKVPPQLNELIIATSNSAGDITLKTAISLTSLLVSEESPRLALTSAYESIGYLPQRVVEEMGDTKGDLHYFLSAESMGSSLEWLAAKYKSIKEQMSAIESYKQTTLSLEDI